jgi:pyruvate,water dikinase
MAVVEDIWAMSRDRLDIDEFLLRHGFHGPDEGELSSRVWREDPAPLLALVAAYRNKDDSEDPHLLDRARRLRYAAAERHVLVAAPRPARPVLRLALHLIRTRLPMRGVAKRSFLQAFDVARGSARRLGEHWAAAGLIDRAEDVFFLTFDEVCGGLPADARDLISRRRARHAAYTAIDLPSDWRGTPPVEPAPDSAPVADGSARAGDITGIGVSAGVVEGRARVMTTPDFTAVEPGEILIAPATDPSWSSIMFITAGLVVDIGGALSHAAVVAREMRQPCVVNTRTGTRQIRTGDLVRVDGGSGVVTILESA